MEEQIKDIKDVRDRIQILRIEQDRLYEDLIERIDIPHEALEDAIEDYVVKNHRFRMCMRKEEIKTNNL